MLFHKGFEKKSNFVIRIRIFNLLKGLEMEVEWISLEEFPRYAISNYGDILNELTGRYMKPNKTMQGTVKIGFMRDGRQYTRSVGVLVAEHFVPGRDEIFDTPIHLDGNPENNRADNLVWRPRWFACQYTNQFNILAPQDYYGPVRDINTGELYHGIYEAGVVNGLLFKDVRRSIIMKESVFPTIQRFEFA